jgi:hypothetical protein
MWYVKNTNISVRPIDENGFEDLLLSNAGLGGDGLSLIKLNFFGWSTHHPFETFRRTICYGRFPKLSK